MKKEIVSFIMPFDYFYVCIKIPKSPLPGLDFQELLPGARHYEDRPTVSSTKRFRLFKKFLTVLAVIKIASSNKAEQLLSFSQIFHTKQKKMLTIIAPLLFQPRVTQGRGIRSSNTSDDNNLCDHFDKLLFRKIYFES